MSARRYAFPIIVVSLPRYRARRQAIRAQLDHLGLGFDFFDGIDAQRDTIPDDAVNQETVERNIGRRISLPEIATALSHRRVCKSILDRGLPGALILEDDVTILPGIVDALAFFEREAFENSRKPEIFHIGAFSNIPLHTYVLGWRTRRRYGGVGTFQKVLLPHQALWGSFGYYMPRAAAASILAAEPQIIHVCDAWQYRRAVGSISAIWLAVPPLVLHALMGSPSEPEAGRQIADRENQVHRNKVKPLWRRIAGPVARRSVYPVLRLLG